MPRKDFGNDSKATQFSSTNQPEKKGRKPSKLKAFIKDNDIGQSDIEQVIKNIIFEHTEDELIKLRDDKKQPMLVRLFIGAFLKDNDNKILFNIEKLLDRAIGKPNQTIKQEHSGDMNLNIKVDFE